MCNLIRNSENLSSKDYLISTFIPKFTLKVLKLKIADENLSEAIIEYLKCVLDMSLKFYKISSRYLQLLKSIFELDCKFYKSNFDLMLNKEESYATIPTSLYQPKSQGYFTMVDYWGRIKGFSEMIKQMTDVNSPLSRYACFLNIIKEIRYNQYFNEVKYDSLVSCIITDVLNCLKSVPIDSLKDASKDELEEIILNLTSIVQKSLMDSKMIHEIIESLSLDFAIKCLQLDILEKKYHAISHINSFIKGLESPLSSFPRATSKQFLILWILDNRLIEILFNESKHSQLIKNSKPILKFILQYNKLSIKLFRIVWECAIHSYDSISQETLGLLSSIASYLNEEQIDFILSELGSFNIEKFTSHVLHFMFEVCNKLEKYRFKFISILWRVLISDEADLVSQLVYKTLNSIFDMPYFIKMRENILFRAIDDTKDSSLQQKKIYLYRIITSSFNSFIKTKDMHKLSHILDKLEDDMSFHSSILKDLKRIKDVCHEKLKDLNVTDINKYLKLNTFPNKSYYIDEIRSRLHLLQTIFSSSDIVIDEKDVLMKIWSMTYDNALTNEERNECLNWFSNIQYRHLNSNSSFSINVTPYIFNTIATKIDFETMKPISFQCFNKFFRDSNAYMKKIIFDERDKNLFALMDHPRKINGENELWNIILICKNAEVVESAMSLLNLLYENVSTKVLTKDELKKLFFDCCLDRLSSITEKDEEFNALKINRVLQLMHKALDKFDASEISKVPFITRGRPLTVTIHLDHEYDNRPKRYTFSLNTHSSELQTSLYKEIKNRCEEYLIQHGLPVTLKFHEPLTKISNKCIDELGIHDFSEIIVESKYYPNDRLTNLKSKITFFKGNDNKEHISDSKILKVMEVTGLSRGYSILALDKWNWDVNRVIKAMLDEETKYLFLKSNIVEENEDDNEIIDVMIERTEDIFSLEKGNSFLSSIRIFDQLFRIFQYNDEATIKTAWTIINSRLPISIELKKSILKLEDGCNNILTKETYRLLYVLNILNKILFPLKYEPFKDRIIKWKEDFISINGHEKLISLLLDYSKLNEKDKNVEDIISLLLKVIDGLAEHDQTILNSYIDDLNTIMKNLFEYFTSTSNTDLIFYLWSIVNKLLSYNSSLLSSIPTIKEGILNLMISNSSKDVRMTTAHELYKIVLSSETAMDEVYNLFYGHKPSKSIIEDKYYDYFFWIFNKVLEQSINKFRSTPDELVERFKELKSDIIHIIKDVNLYEQNSQNINRILCGFIQTLTIIMSYWPNNEDQDKELIEYVFYELLFKDKKSKLDIAQKCKSEISRQSTFKLLLSLAHLNKENFDYTISLINKFHSKLELDNIGWTYSPENSMKSSTGYVGLENKGSKGYINSILQQLYMSPSIAEGILSIQPVDSKIQVVEPFKHIIGHLYESEKISYSSNDFYYNVFELEGNLPSRHQDAAEFFKFLCERIKTEAKGTDKENLLHESFATKVSSIISSEDENFTYVSEKEETLYTIPLDVKQNNNLESALDFFTQKEILEGENKFYCDEYKAHIDASKQSFFASLPNTLVFQIMRFEYDLETGNRNKLNYYFEFPINLDMKRWMKNNEGETCLYALVGIIVHDDENSHYYSIIKERYPPYRFIQFNDSKVQEFDINKLNEYFGGMQTKNVWSNWESKFVKKDVFIEKNAYMLFYEKVDYSNQQQSMTAKELIVPSNIRNEIWKENSTILKHLYIFNKSYFDFFKELLCNNIDMETNKEISYQHMISLSTRIIFEVIAHSRNNDCIYRMISYLKEYYKRSTQACIDFIEYAGEGYIIKKILIECPNEYIRIEFCDFLLTILSTLSQNNVIYHSNGLSKDTHFAENVLIKVIYDLLEDTRSHWQQFKQYFQVIKGYANFGPQQRLNLLELGIIKEYVDYYICKPYVFGKREPIMDNEFYADMTEFYDIISILIRGCNIHQNSTPPPNKVDGLLNVSEKLFEPLWSNNFFIDFIKSGINTNAVIDIIKYMSYNSFENTDFVMRHLLKLFNDNQPVAEQLFDEMILLEDSEENIHHRIQNYIISYKSNSSNKCESLLRVAKIKYKTMNILNYILKLAHKSNALVKVLSTSRHIFWMIDKYESALQKKYDSFIPDVDTINNDLENNYHLFLFSDDLPNDCAEEWRIDKDYFGFLFSHFIARQSKSPSYYDLLIMYQTRQSDNLKFDLTHINDKREKLREKSKKLQDHASYLIKLIKKNKNNYSGDISPYIENLYSKVDLSLEDENTIFEENVEMNEFEMNEQGVEEEEEDQNNQLDIFSAAILSLQESNDYVPIEPEENIDEKLETLKAFFSYIDEDILINVLKDNNYNVELAANDIMDEETMKKYMMKNL